MPAPDRAGDDALVDLTGLEVIRRYSLAVRQGSARRGDVIAALSADLDRLAAATRAAPSPTKAAPTRRSAAKRAPAGRTARG